MKKTTMLLTIATIILMFLSIFIPACSAELINTSYSTMDGCSHIRWEDSETGELWVCYDETECGSGDYDPCEE